jgi:calcineurin-like phosphoesterase family protein
VAPGDTVYHLGDFALSWGAKHSQPLRKIFDALNGQKFLIVGNHDRKQVLELPWVKVTPLHELRHNGRVIVLCHYPLRSWRSQHYGSWMLHGHCHGNLEDRGGQILDVGVDCHGYRPISIDAVDTFMTSRYPAHHDAAKRENASGTVGAEVSVQPAGPGVDA